VQECSRIPNPAVKNSAFEAGNQRLRGLLDALPGGIVVLDGDGLVSDINTTGREWFGELTAQPWYAVVARLFEPTADGSGEVSMKNGQQLAVTTCPMAGEAGQILLFQDVTQSRLQQQYRSRASRLQAMGETAARLAHQIRTPLATAILYLSHLDTESEHGRQIAEKIRERLRHLESLIEDMLVFARGGSQVTEKLRVADLLDRAIDNQLSLYQQQGVRLMPVAVRQDLYIRANRDALVGAMNNLLENALQVLSEAKTEAGVVEVKAEPQQHEVCITVRDNGPGVDEAERACIFEPFYTTRSQGTGLGLAVVQLVVRAHQGSVQALPVKDGACFELRLPLCTATSVENTAAASAAKGT